MSRSRAGSCAVAATAALALGACGEDESEAGEARDAARSYLAALAAGDSARACSLLTAPARRRFVTRMAAISRARDCRGAFDVMLSGSGSRLVRRAARAARPGNVEVEGDEATVTAAGKDRQFALHLRREGGAWRVEDVPGG